MKKLKIKDLRRMRRIDPFTLGDNRVNEIINKSVEVTGLDREFFVYRFICKCF